MASPLDPTKRIRSYREKAVSDFQTLMRRFAKDQEQIRNQKEIIKSLSDRNAIEISKLQDDKVKGDIKTFENDYQKPATKNLNSTKLIELLDGQEELGRREDGTFIYDDKMTSLIPDGQIGNYQTGQQIYDEYQKRINSRKGYIKGERALRNPDIEDEVAIAQFEELYDLHQKGFITESEMDEIYGLMEKREVPGYFTPKSVQATTGLTVNQAANNYGQVSYAYARFRSEFVKSKENIEKYIPQELQNLYEKTRRMSDYTPTEKEKFQLDNIDRFFNQAATREAGLLFDRVVASEQTKRVYEVADEYTKGMMFAELGGLAVESIPELREFERTELNNFLESEEGKEAKAKLVGKLVDALGPIEGWQRFLDNKNRKHKLILIED